jgi:hypothetical protein
MIFAKQVSVLAIFAIILSARVATLGNSGSFLIADAQARPGRPASPTSVAGVARRTTRRTIRRTSAYVATLPRGCSTVVVEGVSLTQCGTTYYQAQGAGYVVVEVL